MLLTTELLIINDSVSSFVSSFVSFLGCINPPRNIIYLLHRISSIIIIRFSLSLSLSFLP